MPERKVLLMPVTGRSQEERDLLMADIKDFFPHADVTIEGDNIMAPAFYDSDVPDPSQMNIQYYICGWCAGCRRSVKS